MRLGATITILLLLLCSAKCRLIMSDEHMKSNANDAAGPLAGWNEQNDIFPFPIVQAFQPKSQSIFIIMSVFCRIKDDTGNKKASTHKITAFKKPS